jgi:hypothetical protein
MNGLCFNGHPVLLATEVLMAFILGVVVQLIKIYNADAKFTIMIAPKYCQDGGLRIDSDCIQLNVSKESPALLAIMSNSSWSNNNPATATAEHTIEAEVYNDDSCYRLGTRKTIETTSTAIAYPLVGTRSAYKPICSNVITSATGGSDTRRSCNHTRNENDVAVDNMSPPIATCV